MKYFASRNLIILVVIVVSGCVVSFKQQYPSEWEKLNTIPGRCPDISGIFSNTGELTPSEKERTQKSNWDTSLTGALLVKVEDGIQDASHVEIIQTDIGEVTVTAWDGSKPLIQQVFSISKKDFTCESGFIEFAPEEECVAAEGTMGCVFGKRLFTKDISGALILKTTARAFLLLPVPATFSQWDWYRFEPFNKHEND